ncbi:MAG: hypothetical protein ABIN13_19280 [Mucilaginibacter sp.]
MKDRSRLILWDVALLIGVAMFIFINTSSQNNLVIGLVTVLILSNCVKNHIAAYKLNGKIY